MDSIYIEYEHEEQSYQITKTELYSVLSSTGECLSPAFNMQVQILIQLIENSGENLQMEALKPHQLAALDQHFPGATVEMLRSAVKAYHAYATNMYYI